MQIAAAAEMAMTVSRAQLSQAVGISMMKLSLQQDAGVLQILAAATQASATTAAAAAPSGSGQVLDVSV